MNTTTICAHDCLLLLLICALIAWLMCPVKWDIEWNLIVNFVTVFVQYDLKHCVTKEEQAAPYMYTVFVHISDCKCSAVLYCTHINTKYLRWQCKSYGPSGTNLLLFISHIRVHFFVVTVELIFISLFGRLSLFLHSFLLLLLRQSSVGMVCVPSKVTIRTSNILYYITISNCVQFINAHTQTRWFSRYRLWLKNEELLTLVNIWVAFVSINVCVCVSIYK